MNKIPRGILWFLFYYIRTVHHFYLVLIYFKDSYYFVQTLASGSNSWSYVSRLAMQWTCYVSRTKGNNIRETRLAVTWLASMSYSVTRLHNKLRLHSGAAGERRGEDHPPPSPSGNNLTFVLLKSLEKH